MFKRIILAVLLVGFIGVLVWGGVVRTLAKNEQVLGVSAEGRGQGGEALGQAQHGRSDLDKAVAAAAHEGEDCATGESCDDDCADDCTDDCADADDGATAAKGSASDPSGDCARGAGEGLGEGDGEGQGQGAGEGVTDGSGQGQGQGQNSQFVEAPEGWETIVGTVVVAPGEDIDLVIETASGELEVGTGPNWMASQGYLLAVGEEVTIVGYEQDGEFKVGTITRASDGESITLRDETGRPAWSGQGRRQNQ